MKKIKGSRVVNNICNWILYVLGYTLIILLSSYLFNNMYIDTSYFGIYALLTSILLYILNKTIKPLIFDLTIPLTGITLGLFYLFINFFMLKLADWLLLSHFELGNTIYAFFIAVFISLMNVLMENIIIKPIIRRFKTNG